MAGKFQAVHARTSAATARSGQGPPRAYMKALLPNRPQSDNVTLELAAGQT